MNMLMFIWKCYCDGTWNESDPIDIEHDGFRFYYEHNVRTSRN